MDAAYPPLSVPASPDYFLSLFRLGFPGRLSADSPADELPGWWNEFDWNHLKVMRNCLTAMFPGHVTAADFDREFPALKGRTVGDVCRFLAERVPRPAVRPWLNDHAAGAFLTVRHQLAAAGADVAGVRPAAPLEPFLRSHPKAFEWELQKLAPGLPFPNEHRPVQTVAVCIAGCCVVLMLLASLIIRMNEPLGGVLTVLGCFGILPACLVAWAVGHRPPRRVTLGDFVTFRDLARAMVR